MSGSPLTIWDYTGKHLREWMIELHQESPQECPHPDSLTSDEIEKLYQALRNTMELHWRAENPSWKPGQQ